MTDNSERSIPPTSNLVSRLRMVTTNPHRREIRAEDGVRQLCAESADEIERLTRERDEYRDGYRRLSEIIENRRSDETAAKRAYYETHDPPHCPTCGCGAVEPTAELGRAVANGRDAERYRWLVGDCGASMLEAYFSIYDVKDWRGVKPALDKAIDTQLHHSAEKASAEPAQPYQRKCSRCGGMGSSATPEGVGVYYCSIECAD